MCSATSGTIQITLEKTATQILVLRFTCYVKLIPGIDLTVGHWKLTESDPFLCDGNILLFGAITDGDTYEKEKAKIIFSFNYEKNLIITIFYFQWTFSNRELFIIESDSHKLTKIMFVL